MKIFNRDIKIKLDECSECKRKTIVIEIKTKKWLKGKDVYIWE